MYLPISKMCWKKIAFFIIYNYIMYLSLSSRYAGNACAIKQSIMFYTTNNNNETQFFDWLVTSMKSINQILENTPILFENPHSLNMKSINFKNFDLLTSHHDIHVFNDNTIHEITEKYKRRYERLINTIKEQKLIYFIRYCKNTNDIEEEEILNFYKNINNINDKLIFKLVLISDDNELIIPTTIITNNFMYINLNNYTNNNILNIENEYFKIIEKYKCVFDIIKKITI
jgi:hypothetical protein